MNQKVEKLIRLNDAIYILRVLPARMQQWQEEGRVTVQQPPDGEQAVRESELKTLTNEPDLLKAALEAFALDVTRREADETSGRNATCDSQIATLIAQYREYIGTLEEIHKTYHDQLDLLRDESALTAAYILYAKVIRLLNMACLCLEHHFWEALILFRPIDEAVELAQYFILTEDGPQGPGHLRLV